MVRRFRRQPARSPRRGRRERRRAASLRGAAHHFRGVIDLERAGRQLDAIAVGEAGLLARGALVRRRPVPLADLLDDLRRDMPLLGAKRFEVDAAADGTIEADPDRIAQVLRNLVSNAVRHSGPEGRVRVL